MNNLYWTVRVLESWATSDIHAVNWWHSDGQNHIEIDAFVRHGACRSVAVVVALAGNIASGLRGRIIGVGEKAGSLCLAGAV